MIELVRRGMSAGVTKVALITAGVVVLGSGTAVAAGFITSADIKNQTIRSWDISEGGVGGSEIRSGAVHTSDIAKDQVGSQRLTPGVRDQLNAPRMSGYEIVGRTADGDSGVAGDTLTLVTKCKSENQDVNDKVAIGGGVDTVAGNDADVVVNSSHPSDITQVGDPTPEDPAGLWAAKSWTTSVTLNGPATVQPYVICAAVN
ncbi:MAG: hypothetical protein ACRDPK_05780 [Carbonactinosporaceae bacterium]